MLKNKNNVELGEVKSDEFVIKIKVLMELTHVFTKHLDNISMRRWSIANEAAWKTKLCKISPKHKMRCLFLLFGKRNEKHKR